MNPSSRFAVTPQPRHGAMRNVGGRLSVPCPSGGKNPQICRDASSPKDVKTPFQKLPSKGDMKSDLKSSEGNGGGGSAGRSRIPVKNSMRKDESLFKQEYLNKLRSFSCRSGDKSVRRSDSLGKIGIDGRLQEAKESLHIDRPLRRNHSEKSIYQNDSEETTEKQAKNMRCKEDFSHQTSSNTVEKDPHLLEKNAKDQISKLVEEAREYFSERKIAFESSNSSNTHLDECFSKLVGLESQFEVEQSVSTTRVRTSRINFALPSMEFVWETDPNGEC